MPRISEQRRTERRRHILTSAWSCFSRNGFHVTSMDDVIAAAGLSSSAVYRYFRSKDDLIDASAEEGLTLVKDIFGRMLATSPAPSPSQVLATIADELHRRSAHADYDLTRLAIQTWAEALRRPVLQERTRAAYQDARRDLVELVGRWRSDGHLSPDADPEAAATILFTLMHGMIMSHHLMVDVTLGDLETGLAALGDAVTRDVPSRSGAAVAPGGPPGPDTLVPAPAGR